MPIYPTLSDVRRSLAGAVRNDVKKAAGDDKVLQPNEAATLRPFVQQAVADLGPGDHGVNDVVDAAMTRVALGWGAVNQSSGPGKTRLSKAEIEKLTQNDPDLGAATSAAAQIAFRKKNPAPALDVHLDGAPAGVTLDKSGSRYTISADASVAVGTSFNVVVDGNALALSRGPAGLSVDDLIAPAGYGLEVQSRSLMTDPVSSAVVQITRDDASWLSPAKLLQKAHAGLTDYVKHTRIHDADWADYFPTTWSGCVTQGVPQKIADFFTASDTQVERKKDSVLYVGRGPFDLYTEIEVSKKDGSVLHALVEID